MMAAKTISVFILLVLSARALAQPLWAEDRQVGYFSEGVSSAGPGFPNIDALYGESDDLFVAMVEHSTTTEGDRLYVSKSSNNGIDWTLRKAITGGNNNIISPSIVRIPGTELLLTAVITQFPNGQCFVDTYRHNSNSLVYKGHSVADFSYPGAGEPVSCTLLENIPGGEVWAFAVDDNNTLFLTRSGDGITWSSSIPVAANAVRPQAEVSSDGHVAVTWIQPGTGKIFCAVADRYGSFGSAVQVSGSADASASPSVAWEHVGDKVLGIVWHNNQNQCLLSMSTDNGLTWSTPESFGEGFYPCIDRFHGKRRIGACYTKENGDILVAKSVMLSGLPSGNFSVRNTHSAYTGGYSIVKYGATTSQLALFFVSEDEKHIWYNSENWTGTEEENSGTYGLSVSVSPNPAGSIANLSSSGGTGPARYRIYSADGRLAEEAVSVQNQFTLDTSELPPGMYLVTCEKEGMTASCRMVRF
ncbi:hypothetical protein CSA37_04655 [Candidatus Fermentibacteria bacterium]|nr:MAG: hypothetical protein CSA37_04655 [Candidatus Fermentibacteria bacterium]